MLKGKGKGGLLQALHSYRLVPLRLYSITALVWFVWLMFYLEGPFVDGVSPVVTSGMAVVTSLATSLVLLVCIFRSRSRSCRPVVFQVTGSLVFAAGISCSYFLSGLIVPPPISIEPVETVAFMGAILEGSGFALMLYACAQELSQGESSALGFVLLGSFAMGGILYYVMTLVGSFSRLIEGILLMALPLVGVIVARCSSEPVEAQPIELIAKRPAQSYLLALSAVILCSVALGTLSIVAQGKNVPFPNISLQLFSMMGTLLAAVILVALCGNNPSERASKMISFSLPILLGGFLLLPFCTTNTVSYPFVVIMVGYFWLMVTVVLSFSSMAHVVGLSRAVMIVSPFLADAVGKSIGNALALVVGLFHAESTDIYRVAIILVALVAFAVGFLLTRSMKQLGKENKKTETSPKALEDLIHLYGLTPREGEILSHVLSRQTPAEIADDLFISVGTVRTHIHSVYKKMGVSSRRALLDLVDSHRNQS